MLSGGHAPCTELYPCDFTQLVRQSALRLQTLTAIANGVIALYHKDSIA